MLGFSDYLIMYGLSVVIFFGIDIVWLAVVAKDLYREKLGPLLREQFLAAPAAIFYALFIIGLVYFAVAPAVREGSWTKALLNGALYGFFTYATYDLTNLSTLKHWPVSITIIDLIWGTVLAATVTFGAYTVFNAIR